MSKTTKLKANEAAVAGQSRVAGRLWGREPEIVALGVLLAGAGVGLVLWAEWGFLIALQTVAMYCF
jgi:hypothetical protein